MGNPFNINGAYLIRESNNRKVFYTYYLTTYQVYRGQVNPWVKDSVSVFLLELHRRGERGRKGRGVQISKQKTQNL